MSLDNALYLKNLFEHQQSLTTWHEMAVQQSIELWRALRESDQNVLKARASWDVDRDYVPDNLAEKISLTFADMLFGEDPIIKSAQIVQQELTDAQKKRQLAAQRAAAGLAGVESPPNGAGSSQTTNPTGSAGRGGSGVDTEPNFELEESEESDAGPSEQNQYDAPKDVVSEEAGSDQERLVNIIEANELPAELYQAEVVCSSEGEVWWRIYADRGQSDYPIIEWHSRSHTRPLYLGRKLVAAAFVSEIHREQIQDQWIVWRYVEIHAVGVVLNVLYKGTPPLLGTEIPLEARPETQNLNPQWDHELGMLCGRVYNKLGRDRRVGMSDYHNIVDLLFSLNEATTIGHENVRLTAKKRIAVPREAIGEDGTFDASEDVLIMDEPLDDQLGVKTAGGKFAVLEYSFDASALIEYKLDLIATILSRVGIVAEFATPGSSERGGGGGAAALSGTALRMRLIPTTLAAKGKARPWDAQLPKILMLAQQIDALPEEFGGFGRPWVQPSDPPSVERGEPLPADETEETQRHVSAVAGEIESRRTAISEMHPNWDALQVQEELDQIENENRLLGGQQSNEAKGPAGAGHGGTQTEATIVDTAG